jgi:hypothetical protein
MRRRRKIAVVAASVAVVVGSGVVSFLVNEPTTYAPAASPPEVTLTLSATGDTTTQVVYTCADAAGVVSTCGPELVPAPNAWSKRVTVPAGTVVRVQARGGVLPGWCSIADASDQLRLDHDKAGACMAVAEPRE